MRTIWKRILLFTVVLVVLLSAANAEPAVYVKHSATFYDAFDTVITYTSYTQTDEEFYEQYALVEETMTRYHQIFDLYNGYEGVNNLYAVNQNAGQAPTPAEKELIDLLLLIREWRVSYGECVNPALGSVLALWHITRDETSVLPEREKLEEAAKHCDFDRVMVDAEAGTVSFEDPEIRLDLGATAKGYSAQLTADALTARGVTHFILNAGGNVICGDAPLDGRVCWTVALTDIDGTSTRERLHMLEKSIVTSGDYQRFVTIDGERYHHLIDPNTLYPGRYMHAVSIICEDSGLGDFLSTAAFLMPYEESRALIESIDDCEAYWVLNDGSDYMTDGFAAYLVQ